jgi:hypothetical protein
VPPLTKAAVTQWAEKAIVPLILATDTRDYAHCTEPVLQKIVRQKGRARAGLPSNSGCWGGDGHFAAARPSGVKFRLPSTVCSLPKPPAKNICC